MNVGDKLPEVLGLDQNGQEITLSSLAGKKLVLYAYPKDNTSGCTAEACSLRDHYDELPTFLYTACRTHYPIPAVTLVELRTFCGMVDVAAIEHYHWIAYGTHAIGRQLADCQHRVEAATAVCPAVDKPAASIVIP